jgi:hypothetical protein
VAEEVLRAEKTVIHPKPSTPLIPVKHIGPLERARQLEGLGFSGISLQQPFGLNLQSA